VNVVTSYDPPRCVFMVYGVLKLTVDLRNFTFFSLFRHAACEVVSVHEEHMPSVTVMSDFEDEVR